MDCTLNLPLLKCTIKNTFNNYPYIVPGGKFSAILQKANVKLNTEKECRSSYNEHYLGLPFGLNWTSMVCAKGDHYKDSCRVNKT